MDPQTTLATIAEVGIAIAGFGGVIAAIASVTPRGFSGVARSIFRALLTGCIMLVAFSLLPQVLATAGLAEPRLWRIASALHAAYLAGIMSYRLIELKRVGGSWKELGLVIYLVYGAALAQLSNAIWFGAGWLYLASLILIMVMAFGIFPRLLAELQSPAQSERSSP